MDTITKLENLIAGLQALVAFLRDKPELDDKIYVHGYELSVMFWSKDRRKEFSALSRMLATGTRLKKEYTDYSCQVTRKFGDLVSLEVGITREAVCQRVVKEVIEHPAEVREAWTEEKVEWICK